MKVGLKETLSLLAAGYKKKDIDAMIAADEEDSKKEVPDTPSEDKQVPAPAPDQEQSTEPEPDYKKMYEELLAKNQQTEAKVTKLQQANVNKDSAPASEEAKKKQDEDLQNLFRSFM